MVAWTFVSCLFVAGPAAGQTIGDATAVVRDVKGVLGGQVSSVALGDSVYRDQILRTAADSSAVVTFLDKTGMAMGPQSEVRLDDFVFTASAGPRTVEAVKGFFRFISGPGEAAHDYRVRTPHATIAVRGTTFDVRVNDVQTTVTLHEGAVDVCGGGACRAIAPGQTVDATRASVGQPHAAGPADWTFTAAPKREQRAALEAAQSALARRSQADHAAFARQAQATAARVAQRAAAEHAAAERAAAERAAAERGHSTRAASLAAPAPAPRAAAPSQPAATAPILVAASAPLAEAPARLDTAVHPASTTATSVAPQPASSPPVAPPPSGNVSGTSFRNRLAAVREALESLRNLGGSGSKPMVGQVRTVFVLPPSAPSGTILVQGDGGASRLNKTVPSRADVDDVRPTRAFVLPLGAAAFGPMPGARHFGAMSLWSVHHRVRDGPPMRPG